MWKTKEEIEKRGQLLLNEKLMENVFGEGAVSEMPTFLSWQWTSFPHSHLITLWDLCLEMG